MMFNLLARLQFGLLLANNVLAQYVLPQTPPEAPRSVVPQEYSGYFGIQPGSELLSLFKGLIPPANFEVAGQENQLNSHSSGISLNNALSGLKINRLRSRPTNGNSSTSGIPDILPDLPRAPVSVGGTPGILQNPIASGFGSSPPDISSILSGAGSGSPILDRSPLPGVAGAFPQGINSLTAGSLPNSAPQNDNLVGQLLKSVGLNDFAPNLDLQALNQILGLSPGEGNVLSQVLYSALTDKPVDTEGSPSSSNRANAAVVQQLLTQPSSPLCSPKPKPVQDFDLEAFEGKYYQVIYSPPMSLGPCSMITFSKLSEIGGGGPGTVLNLFEYTTERTPNGRPSISSGYAIVRAPGQLIFRTSSNPTDLNVYVLHTGPKDKLGRYEYVILSVNCNYPIYVYARDPVIYKQKYDGEVNSILEQRGLATSWARLFNVIAPVDSNLCTFPPTLFNVEG